MTQHWLFACSYFRIALTFKLSFSVDPEKAKKEITKRENFVKIFGLLVWAITELPWLILPFIPARGMGFAYAIAIVDLICFFLIVVVLTFSIFRIRKYSKMLV